MIMLMSWVALEIVSSVRRELTIQTSPVDKLRLRENAYHLMEITFGVLDEIRTFESGLYSPAQGWDDPLYYAGIDPGTLPPHLLSGNIPPADNPDATDPETDGERPASLLDELLADDTANETPAPSDIPLARNARPGPEILTASGETLAPLSLPPGISAQITITDESGKLSLTATTEARWKLFFETMGFESSEVNILTDSLLDWMDSDDRARTYGAESETYRQRDPPYDAANRPLRDFQELRLIQGFDTLFFDEQGIPNQHFLTFTRCVSLHHTDEPNLNTAPPLILQTLAEEQGFEWERLDTFLAGDDRIRGTADDPILHPRMEMDDVPLDRHGNPISVDRRARFLTIEILVTDGMNRFTLAALIDLGTRHPNGIYPFNILKIIENHPLT